jgi:hypothetical protein
VAVEECARLSVHDGLMDVAWFCVCASGGGSLAGKMDVSLVVEVV